MADIELVIKIPEKEFGIDINDKFQDFFSRLKAEIKAHLISGTDLVCGAYELETIDMFLKAFDNGTPLPKGHGKLMDADAFANFLKNISKTQRYNEFIIDKQLTGITVDDVFNVICESLQDENSVPTIIEADTEREDNE